MWPSTTNNFLELPAPFLYLIITKTERKSVDYNIISALYRFRTFLNALYLNYSVHLFRRQVQAQILPNHYIKPFK
jgi:hypothetical protein